MANLFSNVKQTNIMIGDLACPSPVFFRDVRFISAVFMADLSVAQKLLPKNKFYHPINFFGQALVALHCLQYKKCDIGTYNEVSISLAINANNLKLDLLNLSQSILTNNFHGYVCHLPVNTEISLKGGLEYFNYPKTLQSIKFTEENNMLQCNLKDLNNKEILTITGPKLKSVNNHSSKMHMFSYPIIKGEIHKAHFEFNILQSANQYFNNSMKIKLGEGKIANTISSLKLARQLQYTYVEKAEAILWLPKVHRG